MANIHIQLAMSLSPQDYYQIQAGAKAAGMTATAWLRALAVKEMASKERMVLVPGESVVRVTVDGKTIEIPVPKAGRPPTRPPTRKSPGQSREVHPRKR